MPSTISLLPWRSCSTEEATTYYKVQQQVITIILFISERPSTSFSEWNTAIIQWLTEQSHATSYFYEHNTT